MAVEITRKERTPAQLRSAAGKTMNARAARRMLALVLEGVDRKTAAGGPAGWTGRPCATGCIATTPRGWRG